MILNMAHMIALTIYKLLGFQTMEMHILLQLINVCCQKLLNFGKWEFAQLDVAVDMETKEWLSLA